MNTYKQSKTCRLCESVEEREISTKQAAFESTRAWKKPCKKCGSIDFLSSSFEIPDMNRDLLILWAQDESLTVLDQDEDIMLADEKNLEILESLLHEDYTLKTKKAVIISSICVVIYDNLIEDDDSNEEALEKAILILKRNIGILDEINEDYICDYIKEKVYPKINRQLK